MFMKFAMVFLCFFSACQSSHNYSETPSQVKMEDPIVCCNSYGIGAYGVKCCEKYKSTKKSECIVPEGSVGGGKSIVDNSYCAEDPVVCCKSYGIGAYGVKCCEKYKSTKKSECVVPE